MDALQLARELLQDFQCKSWQFPPKRDKPEEGIKPSCEVRPAAGDCPLLSPSHPGHPVKARGPRASSHPDPPAADPDPQRPHPALQAPHNQHGGPGGRASRWTVTTRKRDVSPGQRPGQVGDPGERGGQAGPENTLEIFSPGRGGAPSLRDDKRHFCKKL